MNIRIRFKTNTIAAVVMTVILAITSLDAWATPNRKERRMVTQGNELFREGHFLEAGEKYREALKIEPSSKEALYNLGLTYIRRAGAAQSDSLRTQLVKAGAEAMQGVAQSAKEKPALAADAMFNLGNIAFNSEDYAGAIQMYKSSLRINPEDEKTRRNLRIAQKKLKQNEDNQNKDNQDKEDQKDKQDQNKDQQQDQNKDKQDQQQEQQNQQNQPKEQEINPQAAEQILNAMENKENQTRARVNKSNNGEKATGRSKNNKRW